MNEKIYLRFNNFINFRNCFLTICYAFFIEQFSFGDYIEEFYKKFNLDMDDDEIHGNYITSGFEELFNNYQDMSGLEHVAYILICFAFLFVAFIFLLSFMITYLCHLRRRSCCKCKKVCSYISIIAAMLLSVSNILYVY